MAQKEIVIVPKTVDNPGSGNCAFYAFAIGLINIIQYENQTGTCSTFNKWVEFDSSINAYYIRLVKFDFNKNEK